MREVQDIFFDEVYWLPSIQKAEQEGVYNALGSGVVYDSCIHGSWPRIKDITNERHGKSASPLQFNVSKSIRSMKRSV